jgi:ABC-type transport system involved in cytochrome c biogenesis permease subunit
MGPFLTALLAGTAALYTLAAVAHVFYMFRRHFDWLAKWSTRGAWVLHSVSLVWLTVHMGRAPVYSLFEFASVFTWSLVSFYIALEYMRDNQAAGSFLLPVIAMVQVAGVALPKSTEGFVQEYPASLIGWHVGVTMMGYGFFVASFVAGALYLLQERNLRRKNFSPLYYRLPSLEALDIWGGRFVYIGLPLLTVGMAAGMGFAHVEWSHFWQADPKVVATMVIWMIYCGYLAMRKLWGWGGRKAAWWSVAGMAGLLINYFVVNMLSQLHRFGV